MAEAAAAQATAAAATIPACRGCSEKKGAECHHKHCPICTDDVDTQTDELAVTACLHTFCPICLHDWLEKQTRRFNKPEDETELTDDMVRRCPTCRNQIKDYCIYSKGAIRKVNVEDEFGLLIADLPESLFREEGHESLYMQAADAANNNNNNDNYHSAGAASLASIQQLVRQHLDRATARAVAAGMARSELLASIRAPPSVRLNIPPPSALPSTRRYTAVSHPLIHRPQLNLRSGPSAGTRWVHRHHASLPPSHIGSNHAWDLYTSATRHIPSQQQEEEEEEEEDPASQLALETAYLHGVASTAQWQTHLQRQLAQLRRIVEQMSNINSSF